MRVRKGGAGCSACDAQCCRVRDEGDDGSIGSNDVSPVYVHRTRGREKGRQSDGGKRNYIYTLWTLRMGKTRMTLTGEEWKRTDQSDDGICAKLLIKEVKA